MGEDSDVKPTMGFTLPRWFTQRRMRRFAPVRKMLGSQFVLAATSESRNPAMGAGAGPCFHPSSVSIFLCHSERSEETRLPEARVEEDRAGRSLSRLDSTSLKRKPLESKDLSEAMLFSLCHSERKEGLP